MNRVLCFGGRDFADAAAVDRSLAAFFDRNGATPSAVIHGGARGADSLCGSWGKRRGLCVIRVDANWDFFNNRAGPVRNGWMLQFCFPTYGIGFPGGSGTRDMAERLRVAGVPVWWPLLGTTS